MTISWQFSHFYVNNFLSADAKMYRNSKFHIHFAHEFFFFKNTQKYCPDDPIFLKTGKVQDSFDFLSYLGYITLYKGGNGSYPARFAWNSRETQRWPIRTWTGRNGIRDFETRSSARLWRSYSSEKHGWRSLIIHNLKRNIFYLLLILRTVASDVLE